MPLVRNCKRTSFVTSLVYYIVLGSHPFVIKYANVKNNIS